VSPAVGGLASGPAPAAFAFVGGDSAGVASASDGPVAVEAGGQRTHLQVQASASTRFAAEAAVGPDRDHILEVGDPVPEARIVQEVAYLGQVKDLGQGGNLAEKHIPGEGGRLARVRKDYGGGLVRGVGVVAGGDAIGLRMGRGQRRGRGGRRELGVHPDQGWV
jgi:hypothetical protein